MSAAAYSWTPAADGGIHLGPCVRNRNRASPRSCATQEHGHQPAERTQNQSPKLARSQASQGCPREGILLGTRRPLRAPASFVPSDT